MRVRDKIGLQVWNERLNFESEKVTLGSKKETVGVIVLIIFGGLFVLEELSGVKKLADPFAHGNNYPGHELKEHEKRIIDQAKKLVSNL